MAGYRIEYKTLPGELKVMLQECGPVPGGHRVMVGHMPNGGRLTPDTYLDLIAAAAEFAGFEGEVAGTVIPGPPGYVLCDLQTA